MINNIKEYENQRDMLQGNLNRMRLTHDMDELEDMFLFAELRLKQMFLYNKRRIEFEE